MLVNRIGALFVGAAALAGCWHATIETGLPAGTETIKTTARAAAARAGERPAR